MRVLFHNIERSRTKAFRATFGFFLLLTLLLASGISKADQHRNTKDKLPKFYSHWLNRDVVYIITNQEKKAFLQLITDQERDNFIQHFWDIRNPTPGSPVNTYKDDIYSRIAYADGHFGIGSGEEGWRTDRGRTYITLGPPQQIRTYYGAANLRPMEMWFYSNLNPALPPFFYVLFYQRDNVGDFRYYSPSLDGPDKLVSGMEVINDPRAALKIIQSSVGPEVARVAQTLIPGEPIDPDGRVGLQSDVLLSILKNLANQPSNVEEISRRREMSESIRSRLILDANTLDILLLPVQEVRGATRLDYAVRLGKPADMSLTREENGQYSYAMEVRVLVYTPDKKLIFTQEKSVSGHLDQGQLDEIKHRRFGYEGVLPLAPGKYHLDFLVTDWTQKVGLHTERDVSIPEPKADTFIVPAILPFSRAEPVDATKRGIVPFAMGGLRFKPLEAGMLVFNQAQKLEVAYQIWASPHLAQAAAGQNITVQYALGKPALTGTATAFKDTVNVDEFTPSGSLVNGKKISLADKPEGNYILTVSVSGPGSSQKTFSTLGFQILNEALITSPWDVDEPGIDTDEAKGVLDQQRGLCYLAQGIPTEARLWFRLALGKNHDDDIARARLVQADYTLNAYSAVVSLFKDAGVTPSTDSATIVQISESLLKTGDTLKAASLLQDTIHFRPEDGSLYMALADTYQQMGNAQQALEMSRKGKILLKTDSLAQ
jgi:GWxTD domain-containing protein